jgi:anion-transporting  ArsA/GET3 family ATPase
MQGVLDKFGMGGMMDQLKELGLDELLHTPPPGLDEAIAIAKVVEFVESASYARFTRIIFDTAPTGHTLRMLSLPDFVSATLIKVQTLQSKLGGAGKLVGALFGDGGGEKAVERLQKLKDRVDMVARLFRRVPKFQCIAEPFLNFKILCKLNFCVKNMQLRCAVRYTATGTTKAARWVCVACYRAVQSMLTLEQKATLSSQTPEEALICRDQENMDFVIVTIPTVMALEESSRLAKSLRKEGVPASTIIVNQIVGESMGSKYVEMKLREQRKAMEMLQASPHLKPLQVITGKLVDLEVRGVPALQYFGSMLWRDMPVPSVGSGEALVRAGAPHATC